MKNIFVSILLSVFIATTVNLVAQQGMKVVYQEQTNVPAQVQEIDDPVIRATVEAQLRNMASVRFSLVHSQGESLYTPDQQGSTSTGNPQIQTQQLGGNAVVYKNQRTRQMVSQENIIDRQFLITEDLPQMQWKLENEEKRIGNYLVRKATIEEEDIIAWYSVELPISDGPGKFSGLPGLILELQIASKTITAQEIQLNYDAEGKIKAPNQGRRVSRQEFDEIRNQRLQQMGVDGNEGGGGVRIIRM